MSEAISGANVKPAPDVASLIRGYRRVKPGDDGKPKIKKADPRPAVRNVAGCPGGAETPPGLGRLLLGLLSLLRLLRLFCLLRFLSHSILFWVNGWKRDTRHAWRRADLATSSMTIPTDSQAAAPYCHSCVITLSTAVMRFGVVSAPRCASHPRIFAVVQRTHRPQRLVRVNTAPTQSRNCASIDPGCARRLHRFKTTARIVRPPVRVR